MAAENSDEPAQRVNMGAITATLAIACGLSVANIYYAQPLLDRISDAFGVSQGVAAIVVTATQVGYAAGLIFLLPLADLRENKKLACRTLLGTAAALATAAVSPDFGIFIAASICIGVTSVVAQVLVPFAAHLAPEAERGRFVGRVMSGLLLGILLARTAASLVAAAWGWRTIYVISAVLMLATSAALWRVLPSRRPDHSASYGALLASTARLLREEPVLRLRAACQFLMFGAFSAFWTSIAYELIDDHGLSQTGIGLFALVGAAGAAAAPIAGWVGDRGWGGWASTVSMLLGVVAMVLAAAGAHQLILLGLAAVLLDLAVQGNQVLSQRDIYARRPEARARITTVYMGSVFLGGSISSAISGVLHASVGWTGVALFSAALPALATVIWVACPGIRRSARLTPRPPAGDAQPATA